MNNVDNEWTRAHPNRLKSIIPESNTITSALNNMNEQETTQPVRRRRSSRQSRYQQLYEKILTNTTNARIIERKIMNELTTNQVNPIQDQLKKRVDIHEIHHLNYLFHEVQEYIAKKLPRKKMLRRATVFFVLFALTSAFTLTHHRYVLRKIRGHTNEEEEDDEEKDLIPSPRTPLNQSSIPKLSPLQINRLNQSSTHPTTPSSSISSLPHLEGIPTSMQKPSTTSTPSSLSVDDDEPHSLTPERLSTSSETPVKKKKRKPTTLRRFIKSLVKLFIKSLASYITVMVEHQLIYNLGNLTRAIIDRRYTKFWSVILSTIKLGLYQSGLRMLLSSKSLNSNELYHVMSTLIHLSVMLKQMGISSVIVLMFSEAVRFFLRFSNHQFEHMHRENPVVEESFLNDIAVFLNLFQLSIASHLPAVVSWLSAVLPVAYGSWKFSSMSQIAGHFIEMGQRMRLFFTSAGAVEKQLLKATTTSIPRTPSLPPHHLQLVMPPSTTTTPTSSPPTSPLLSPVISSNPMMISEPTSPTKE